MAFFGGDFQHNNPDASWRLYFTSILTTPWRIIPFISQEDKEKSGGSPPSYKGMFLRQN